MAKVNTHGQRIKGLKKASGKTYDIHNGLYFEIFYDKSTGDVWTQEQQPGCRSEYRDPDVICVARTTCHVTMQGIADAVKTSGRED